MDKLTSPVTQHGWPLIMQEPVNDTGIQWRIGYSIQFPDLTPEDLKSVTDPDTAWIGGHRNR